MTTDLQRQLFTERADKTLFETAKEFAYAHLDSLAERSVFPNAEDLAQAERLHEAAPMERCDGDTILRKLHEHAARATVTAQGGRYFGFVTGGMLPITLAARWLVDSWDQNAPLFKTSPVASIFEDICEKWLREYFNLPDETVAGFVSGSSLAIFSGLAAARYRLLANQGWNINAKGLFGAPPIRVIASNQAHATVVKAIALLGLGIDNVEWAEVDDQGRIIPERLPQLDDKSLLLLQAGDVNSGAFDHFDQLCGRARDAGAWTHIDGAFGLWAAAIDRFSHLTAGMEHATSWSVDAHKTLNTPYDCGIILCKDKEALNNALHVSGSYITPGEHRDGMFYTPELSRRARAIEVWAALKYLGREGLSEMIGALHDRSLQFAEELSAAGIKPINDVVFNQTFIAGDDDAHTAAMIDHIQQSGECWVGGAKWFGRDIIRISVCSWATTPDDVSRSVRAIVAARDATR